MATQPISILLTEDEAVPRDGVRCKLEADPANPRYFLADPGVGYRVLNRALGAQLFDLLAGVAERTQDLFGMRAKAWDRLHARLIVRCGDRRQQRFERSRFGLNLAPTITGCKLWMIPKFLHRVQPRVRNACVFQPCDHVRRRKMREI